MATYSTSFTPPPENTPPPTTQSPVTTSSTSTTSTPIISNPPTATFDTNADDPGVYIIPAVPNATFDTNPNDPAVDIVPALIPANAPVQPEAPIVPVTPSVVEVAGIITDQYTSGGEFVLTATGEDYIGSYHIHPDKGFMVGAQHVNTPHAYLTPRSTVDVPEANTDTFTYNNVPGSRFIARFIGTGLSVSQNIMFRGIVQGRDGKLYLVPYASDNLVVTDLSTGAQPHYNITSYASYGSLAKFIGGVIAPNGKIYLGPQQASSPLIIDTNQTPPVLSQVSNATAGIAAQARGLSLIHI